mmetsp:Transcript_11925/g.14420  ORF Transcript_11925/g.14420 Transcript_11925/m.14420 type:complete len:131 (-) Transcript_11925:268-660(-)
MSKHYICGQFEDSYQAPKLRVWESKGQLRPATSPMKTVCSDTYRNKELTKFMVNEKGHLTNRKESSPMSFNMLPEPGSFNATKSRWPALQSNASVPYASRATFGYKGIPSDTGFSSTVKMNAECHMTNTR